MTVNDQRRQLWTMLSDLWLDTEITDRTVERIAVFIRESGLDRAELELIFHHELAPFLNPNLTSLAGEWSGFNAEWVCEKAQELHDKRVPLGRLRPSSGAPQQDWQRVLKAAFGDHSGT